MTEASMKVRLVGENINAIQFDGSGACALEIGRLSGRLTEVRVLPDGECVAGSLDDRPHFVLWTSEEEHEAMDVHMGDVVIFGDNGRPAILPSAIFREMFAIISH